MCGIAGCFDTNCIPPGFEGSSGWLSCMNSLRKRGPDGEGTWGAPSRHAILGHTRLAIVDPSPAGDQPMVNGNNQISITYNGELYNASKLRTELESDGYQFRSSCDTEVLLNAWIRWGRKMLPKLLGMYAFVIWDDQSKRLFGAVDHVGMKPLVWKQEHTRLLIASECDSLRALSGAKENLSSTAVRNVLTMSCCPPPMTMWEGIYKLPPGHCIEWSIDEPVRVSRYYSPPECIDEEKRVTQENFEEIWEQIVSDHMIADVPVGAFLSGGIDSAATVLAATKAGTKPHCFTLEMEGDASEHLDAQRVAHALGLPITIEKMSLLDHELHAYCGAYDEPQSFSALLTMVNIARLGGSQVRSVIGGDGGDETFGGYLWQREHGPDAWQDWHDNAELKSYQSRINSMVENPDSDDRTRVLARKVMGSHSYVHGYLARVFPGFHPAEARAMSSSWDDPYTHEQVSEWLVNADRPELPHLRRVQRLDLVGFCPASILPKVDRGAMHYGLEIRSPMLDRRLIDIGLTQPVDPCELIADGSQSRPHLRSYLESNMGTQSTKRPKQGFSVRTHDELRFWRARCEQLSETKLIKQGILNTNWASYIPFGDMTRLRSICMLASWAESRIV